MQVCHHLRKFSNNIYDLSGRMVKLNAKAEDLQGLKKGIYIYNNKKYVAK